MDPRQVLKGKLADHSQLRWSETAGDVRIEPPNDGGFSVTLARAEGEWVVYLGEGGFHEAFDSGDEALNFVAWCFSGEGRLRETRRGRHVAKCRLEAFNEGRWRVISVTGFPIVPFWRRATETTYVNENVLKGW